MSGQDVVEAVFKESRRFHVLEGPQNGRNAIHDGLDVFWARRGDKTRSANMALGGRFADAARGVRETLGVFEGLPFLWFLRPDAEFDATREAMRDAGFTLEDDERCMLLEPEDARPAPPPSGFDISEARSVRDLEAFLDAYQAAFHVDDASRAAWLAHHAALLPRRDRMRYLVGRVEGEAIACGAAFLGAQAVGVYSVGVAPAWQRRGFGAAMTWRVVEEGLREGRTRAILGATPAGKRTYEKLGFRDVGGLDAWLPPGIA